MPGWGKRHTVTDENGMVLAEETTAANESDMKHLEHAQHIMESVAYNLYRTPGIIVSNCIR